jgi:hypothetical protein
LGTPESTHKLAWCEMEGITRAVFTDCGSRIVGTDGRCVAARVRRLGREHGVVASIAYDGLSLAVP